MSDFAVGLAKDLTYDLLKWTSGRLRDVIVGDAESRAFERAWNYSFQFMLEAVAAHLNDDSQKHLDSVFREFINTPGVADGLIDLALEEKDPPLDRLRQQFDVIEDFHRPSLEVNFDRVIIELTRGLSVGLETEAGKKNSPLYHKINLRTSKQILSQLIGIKQILAELVNGVESISSGYAVRIQNFLTEYLGTENEKVPFGGRDAQLEALDAWISDPSAPPYALMAAEAGRGKSAILARWAQSIVERDIAHTVFIPINFKT